jgi:hypothetical protein
MPTFTAVLNLYGKTATGFEVPAEVVEALNSGKRVPVTVTINHYSFRNTLAVYGGQFMLGISAEHRGKAGIAAGDLVEIQLEVDQLPRTVEIPLDLEEALKQENLLESFAKQSYTNRKEAARSVTSAKQAETRLRRIRKIVAHLQESKE